MVKQIIGIIALAVSLVCAHALAADPAPAAKDAHAAPKEAAKEPSKEAAPAKDAHGATTKDAHGAATKDAHGAAAKDAHGAAPKMRTRLLKMIMLLHRMLPRRRKPSPPLASQNVKKPRPRRRPKSKATVRVSMVQITRQTPRHRYLPRLHRPHVCERAIDQGLPALSLQSRHQVRTTRMQMQQPTPMETASMLMQPLHPLQPRKLRRTQRPTPSMPTVIPHPLKQRSMTLPM